MELASRFLLFKVSIQISYRLLLNNRYALKGISQFYKVYQSHRLNFKLKNVQALCYIYQVIRRTKNLVIWHTSDCIFIFLLFCSGPFCKFDERKDCIKSISQKGKQVTGLIKAKVFAELVLNLFSFTEHLEFNLERSYKTQVLQINERFPVILVYHLGFLWQEHGA